MHTHCFGRFKVKFKWASILSSGMRLTPHGWDVMSKEIEEAKNETNEHDDKKPVCITRLFHSTKLRR